MTSPFARPAPQYSDAFTWGCCIQGYHFLYVYGTTADYHAFQKQDGHRQGHTLHKGRGDSLDEVQQRATAAAGRIGDLYAEVGSVNVANARDLLRTEPARARALLAMPAAR